MGICCSKKKLDTHNQTSSAPQPTVALTEEEKAQRRKLQADAALERSKQFAQGGGGEKLKAKAKALEEAEKHNKAIGPDLDWN